MSDTNAQTASASGYLAAYHVFPLFVNGRLSDGSYYRTTLMISNPSDVDSTTCTLQIGGLPLRYGSYTMAPGGWIISSTNGAETFQSSYATLQCSANVEPQLMYSYYNSDGIKVSEATTFSSPPAGTARLIGDQRNGSQLGIALANDSDQPVTFTISVAFGSKTGSVTVGPRSSLARFLNELVPGIPSDTVSDVLISSADSTTSAIGLRFTGNVFATIPEASANTPGPAAGTSFIFPQFAEGKFADGSYFRTAFMYQTLGNTNCNETERGGIIGGGNLGTFGPIAAVVPLLSDALYPNQIPRLSVGYSTIQCSAPVNAEELLSYYDKNGAKLSEATVFPSPSASRVQILADTREGARIALAMANDSDQTVTYGISVIDVSGTVVGTATETIPARENAAKFIDEFVTLPANYYGKVTVSSSTGPVSVIGMRFMGSVFTTVPETISLTTVSSVDPLP